MALGLTSGESGGDKAGVGSSGGKVCADGARWLAVCSVRNSASEGVGLREGPRMSYMDLDG
jgi:hypothetical protein